MSKRVGEIPLSHINAIRQNAIKRNFLYSVSEQYLWDLFLKQERRCALSNVELVFTQERNASRTRAKTTASLDRIDNSKGYEVGNVRWLHKDVNVMRSDNDDATFIEWCRKCFLRSASSFQRPSFDEYFMMLAFDVSTRSEDKQVKHGAIIVDKASFHIIGTGYNGTMRGSDKSLINFDDREEKRKWMIHAEENAIFNCTRNILESPSGAIMYITGRPCNNCLQRIVNFGIKEVCCAARVGSITENEQTEKMKEVLISMSGIKIREISLDNPWVRKVFLST